MLHRSALALVALVPLCAAVPAGADLLVRNARLLDGTGAAARSTSILVRGNRIAAIVPGIEAPGVPVLDAAGGTVIPGLVDAHVHLAVVPGAGQRDDPPALTRQLRRAHLRAYLACGVTTVLDAAIDPSTAREIRAWLAAGHPGPRVLMLGRGFLTPGGYLAGDRPAVATPADVEAQLAEIERLGAVGAKVFVERGFGPFAVWPIPAPDVRAAIMAGAARRKLPLYVHANREEDKDVALDMDAHAIMHTGFYRTAPTPAFVARMTASGAYLVTTFAIMDARLAQFHPERLDDPLVRRTVPPVELATARDPAAGGLLARREVEMALPWLPGFLQGPVARVFTPESAMAAALGASQHAAHTLWAAGVPIVVGTDAGNWPVVPYQFHGPTTLREIELLGAAGLPPADALAAATRVPARMLGREAEFGTVEIGKRADLVVLRKDPLRSLRALRTIRWVVRDGVARTPREWLAASAD